MILILYAHPYPQRSRTGRALLAAVRDLPRLEVRSLYELYPDFDIDVAAEQAALTRADLVVWLHPLYWYSVPAMLKYWFDVVLLRGWAYGERGDALHGKRCLWVTSTGERESAFTATGMHQRPFAEFAAPIRQTAIFCGMEWESPITLFGTQTLTDNELASAAQALRERLMTWSAGSPASAEPRRPNDFA